MYNSPDVKPWTSGKWAPPGYASRYDFAKAKVAVEDNLSTVGSHTDSNGHVIPINEKLEQQQQLKVEHSERA